jgi:hypothetical protein
MPLVVTGRMGIVAGTGAGVGVLEGDGTSSAPTQTAINSIGNQVLFIGIPLLILTGGEGFFNE